MLVMCAENCGVVETIILRGVVPALLAIGVLTALIAAGRVSPGARVAAYAGFWAGLILFFAVALVILPAERAAERGLALWPALGLLGLPVGLAGPAFYWFWRSSRWAAVACLIQSFGASTSLLCFYALPGARAAVVWLALSVAVGNCLAFLVPRRFVKRALDREYDVMRFRGEKADHDREADLGRRHARLARWRARLRPSGASAPSRSADDTRAGQGDR